MSTLTTICHPNAYIVSKTRTIVSRPLTLSASSAQNGFPGILQKMSIFLIIPPTRQLEFVRAQVFTLILNVLVAGECDKRVVHGRLNGVVTVDQAHSVVLIQADHTEFVAAIFRPTGIVV
jgi:hypothetical protein